MNHSLVRSRAIAAIIGFCAVVQLTACEKAKLENLTAPTPPVTPTSGLTIDSVSTSVAVGDAVQLTVRVVLPDGITKPTDAAWQSSDPSVTTVTDAGLVKVRANGSATITATAYEQTASVHLPAPYLITGIVHESAPTATVPVVGARVAVEGGLDGGTSTITDADGRFHLEAESAGFSLAIGKDGDDSATILIGALPRDQHPDVALVPDAIPVTRTVLGWSSPSRLCHPRFGNVVPHTSMWASP